MSVWQLARVAHPISSRHQWLMMIAYFDDSGHSINSAVLTVACVVAKSSKWKAFEEKWSKRLRRASVQTFHMTDYENRRQEFAGWDDYKRTAFIADLAAILKNAIAYGVAGSVLMVDWLAVMPQRFVREDFVARRGAYSLLFQLCLEQITEVIKLPPTETMSCVFDENNFIKGAIAEHYVDWKREHKLGDRFGSLVFANKRQLLPLQAADMVAYESYKHVTNQILAGTPRRERKLHENLWRSNRIRSFGLTQDGLRSYLASIGEMHKTELEARAPSNHTS